METRIYLIRHTQTIGNVENRLTGIKEYEITHKGKSLIEKLTNKFTNINIDAIYSSTSKRAIETVKQIAVQKRLEIIEDTRLKEMYFGIYDGWKWEEVNRVNPNIQRLQIETNEIMQIPEQETTKEVADRMYKVIKEISRKNTGKNVIVASHGVAIEAFIRKVTNESFRIKREEYSQHNTSVNELIYNDILEKFSLIKVNDLEHIGNEKIARD